MTSVLIAMGCFFWGLFTYWITARPRVLELEGAVRLLRARVDELTAENWRIMGELRAAQAKRRFLR